MNTKEKELIKKLCSFNLERFNEELLEAATPVVLGYLFFNRMQAVAYGTLKKHGFLGKVNREFRNSLKGAYMQNIEKNKSFFSCVEYIEKVLSNSKITYAMLKGACLCGLYPEGYRTSNDIDILVHSDDVTQIGNAPSGAGFNQGYIRNGIYVPASRKEIIESKMMRGETVPYIKEIDLPGMQFLEVDINFSLDYKPGDTDTLEQMMKNTVEQQIADLRIHTLRNDDFFIHLCAHLYKEASTLPWVEMMRDMTLYKYCDIYYLLNNVSKEYIDRIFERAKILGMEKICAFAIIQMSELFDFENDYAVNTSKVVLSDDPEFLHMVASPREKKIYVYDEKDILKRFFAKNRKKLLKEVK